jgi:hypothetical protein
MGCLWNGQAGCPGGAEVGHFGGDNCEGILERDCEGSPQFTALRHGNVVPAPLCPYSRTSYSRWMLA